MATWQEDGKCCEEKVENEIERLERQIKDREQDIADKKAYLEFLKANPLFVEYQKLRLTAN